MVSSQKCPFCNPIADEIVAQNDLCYARWDRTRSAGGTCS